MIILNHHIYRCGPNENYDLSDYDLSDEDIKNTGKLRKHIEPWLTAVFQSEHLSLLLGSGFTSGVASAAGGNAANMTKCEWTGDLGLKEKVDEYAEQIAKVCRRGAANIEDQIRAAMQLEGPGPEPIPAGEHGKPIPGPSPEPEPEPTHGGGTRTFKISGDIPPEIWNRLGTKVLPKLRSGSDLKIGIEFSVTVEGQLAQSFETDLVQILADLGLTDQIRVD